MTTLARDENRRYWNDRTKDLDIRKGFELFAKRMEYLADGRETQSQMLIGPPGCGKGTVVANALKNAGRAHRLVQDVSTKQLKIELDECASLGSIAVVDDADRILKDVECLETLMRATSSEDDAFGRQDSVMNRKTQETYSYVGLRIVVISNDDPMRVGFVSPAVLEAKIRPLMRRMKLSRIVATHEDRYAYTCHLVIVEHILRRTQIPSWVVNTALEFLARNRHRMHDVSPGAVKNFCRTIQLYPDVWQDDLAQSFDRDRNEPAPDLGRIPRLIAADRNPKVACELQSKAA